MLRHPPQYQALSPDPEAGSRGRTYYVFILSTPARGLSLGVTNDLERCLVERRSGAQSEAAARGAARLVYFEVLHDLARAVARKAQLEGWNRSRKLRLIVATNPDLRDLSIGLGRRKEA